VTFFALFEKKNYIFVKLKCHVTGAWGPGPCQCHQMTHGGGVVKNRLYYLNGP